MKKQYIFFMFILCFCVWAVVVDNMVLPEANSVGKQHNGLYARYRVKEWSKDGKLGVLEDELQVYVIVGTREQCYYMDYNFNFKNSLENLPAGTPVQIRYVNRFPKFWKRHLYDLRIQGISKISYSQFQLDQKQRKIWKFTGIMGGVFLVLIALGLVNKPRTR